jgi:hypothetical protein
MKRETRDTLFAWAALAAGALAWFGTQQLGANVSFADCGAGSGLFDLIMGVLALALIAGGALLSLRIWRGRKDEQAPAAPFIAFIGIATGGLLAIAIVLQMLSALIIPSCFA